MEKSKWDHHLTERLKASATCRIISLLVLRLQNDLTELLLTYPNRLFIEFSAKICNCILSKFAFYRNLAKRTLLNDWHSERKCFSTLPMTKFSRTKSCSRTKPISIVKLPNTMLISESRESESIHYEAGAFGTCDRLDGGLFRWTNQTVFVRWEYDLCEDVNYKRSCCAFLKPLLNVNNNSSCLCKMEHLLTGLPSFVPGSTSISDNNGSFVVLWRSTGQPDHPIWLPATFSSGVIRNPLSIALNLPISTNRSRKFVKM